MIPKSELIQMLWGIVCHDSYWVELNSQKLSCGEIIVAESERDYAKKIGWALVGIRSELAKNNEQHSYDIPALVLDNKLPEGLNNKKVIELIEVCRRNADYLSNA